MSLVSVKEQDNALMLDQVLVKSGSFLLVGQDKQKIKQVVKDMSKKMACSNSTAGQFCDTCRDCQLIELAQHPDICWINPTGSSAKIKIEDIRILKEKINLKPYQISKKLFVITEAQRMGPEAANALLKTLEEPPLNASLILIASNTAELLPTVVSRCQLIRFSGFDKQNTEDSNQINDLILRFFGSDEDIDHLSFYEDIAELDRSQVEALLNELAYILRDILMYKISKDKVQTMSYQDENDIAVWSEMFSVNGLEQALEAVLHTSKCVRRNANIKLAIDLFIKTFDRCRL